MEALQKNSKSFFTASVCIFKSFFTASVFIFNKPVVILYIIHFFHIKTNLRSEDQEDGEQYNHTGYQYTFPVPVLIS